MDNRTYQQIYAQLNSAKDIGRISREFSIKIGAASNIFHMKTVRHVKKYHSRIVRKAPLLHRSWQGGDSILKIARQNKFPPVLIASIILKEMGLSSRSVIKNPQILKDKRLRNEVIRAMDDDLHFSPRAHAIHSRLGKKGEQIICEWLIDSDIDFIKESDMRKTPNTKTPDFVLHEPLDIDGSKVIWIESKAVFADDKEHNRYIEKQFKFYEDLHGPGMVVYWYGFLDNIVPNDYIITDYVFFEYLGYNVDGLADCMIES